LALNNPAPQEFVAVNDSFGEAPEPLPNNQAIVEAVERVVKRK
jgi:transketolase